LRYVPERGWPGKHERGSLVVIPLAECDTIREDFIPSPGSIDGLRVEQVLFGGASLGKARLAAPGLGLRSLHAVGGSSTCIPAKKTNKF
jgi:hypothetical protein